MLLFLGIEQQIKIVSQVKRKRDNIEIEIDRIIEIE